MIVPSVADLHDEFRRALHAPSVPRLPEPALSYVAGIMSERVHHATLPITGVQETSRLPLDITGRFAHANELEEFDGRRASLEFRFLGDAMLFTVGFAPEHVLARQFRGAMSFDAFLALGASCYARASNAWVCPEALPYMASHFDNARKAVSGVFRDEYQHRWRRVSCELVLLADATRGAH